MKTLVLQHLLEGLRQISAHLIPSLFPSCPMSPEFREQVKFISHINPQDLSSVTSGDCVEKMTPPDRH